MVLDYNEYVHKDNDVFIVVFGSFPMFEIFKDSWNSIMQMELNWLVFYKRCLTI
jgi:hypothetical protein